MKPPTIAQHASTQVLFKSISLWKESRVERVYDRGQEYRTPVRI
jgi:hypothetical protein